MNVRAQAAEILCNVLIQKRSLAQVFNEDSPVQDTDRSLLKELVYGVIRWYFLLAYTASRFLRKSLRSKDEDIQIVILLGLYQLMFLRIPPHAAVYETVKLTKHFKKSWAKPLVNAVLQNFLREKASILEKIDENEVAHYSHPPWLLKEIKLTWPQHWQQIIEANNEKPPLSIRVNAQKISREKYQAILQQHGIESQTIPFTEQGLSLQQTRAIPSLPYFEDGYFSVQDGAAQLAAPLLNLQPHLRVLDACAAPGGKTSHILETNKNLQEIVAVEKDPRRMVKIEENLQRLHLNATLICEDVENIAERWDEPTFDRILLDAPCSATGVIRRNPDIKILRQASDIKQLAQQQQSLMQKLWLQLKPGGILLYATCSVLLQENVAIAKSLLESFNDCHELIIEDKWGLPLSVGRQILPGENNMDGFYYARFIKRR